MSDSRYLAPALLQGSGLLLLFGCAIFWGFTHQESPLFVGAALSLIGIGATQGIRVSVQREREKLVAQASHDDREAKS